MAEFFRVQKTSNYTVVDNQCIRDKRLSYKARMLLILMLSVRDDFQITKRWLVQNSDKDGRDSVESGLIELQKCGYLKVTRQRNSKGQLSDALYTIYEIPVTADSGESTPEQPEPENPSQAPEPEKPAQEKPAQENPHYRNTNIRNTIPPISPTGEGDPATALLKPDEILFASFWKNYPARNGRKNGKADAKKVWARLKITSKLYDKIMCGLYAYLRSDEVVRGYAMDAARWLRNRRWEDEVVETPPPVPADPILPGERLEDYVW